MSASDFVLQPEALGEIQHRAEDEVRVIIKHLARALEGPNGLILGQMKMGRQQRLLRAIDDLTRDEGRWWLVYSAIAPDFARQELSQLDDDLAAERKQVG